MGPHRILQTCSLHQACRSKKMHWTHNFWNNMQTAARLLGKTDWQRAGRLILFNLPAEYFFVAGQSKLAMIGLGIISSWCVWVKTGCAAYILLRLGSHQRRNIIQNLEHRWKKNVFCSCFIPQHIWLVASNMSFIFPFHLWDVIPTPLTFTPSFLKMVIAPPTSIFH